MDAFIDARRHEHGVEPICRELTDSGIKIAPSAYYARKTRPPSARTCADAVLDERLITLHDENMGVYGARKMWKAYARAWPAEPVARCTIERRMRALGLAGVPNARSTRTTTPVPGRPCPLDALQRDFTAPAPDTRWVADITYVATWTGFVYVAFVMDLFSRRIVGWRVSNSLRTDLALDALEQGIWVRQRNGRDLSRLTHHSDRGCQYLAIRYTERLAEAGIEASVGSTGDSYDNAAAEALNKLFKKELIWRRGPWPGLDTVELATLEWVDWYNNQRLHSYCGDIPPAELEDRYYAEHTTEPAPASPAQPALH